jgi:hypothetical protein
MAAEWSSGVDVTPSMRLVTDLGGAVFLREYQDFHDRDQ